MRNAIDVLPDIATGTQAQRVGRPVVDVLIPVFNGEQYIEDSIRSIQQQSLADILIHVVNDGSTDSTQYILDRISASDPRVLTYSKENGGIVDSLNFGIGKCSAEFIARHDADDLAYRDRLDSQLTYLTANPDVVAIGASARHIDPQGRALGTIATFPPTENADPAAIPAAEPYLLHPFLMVRREVLVQIGGYRHVVHAEDTDLYWRLLEKGKLQSDKSVQGEYRLHSDSISSQSIKNGRVMAISSQLCALSAQRRKGGLPDIEFSREAGEALKSAAHSLEEAVRVADRTLSATEIKNLHISAATRLLDLADFRPYEVESSDCAFARSAIVASLADLREPSRSKVLRSYSGAAARLAASGRWRDADLLVYRDARLQFLAKLLLRIFLPKAAFLALRRIRAQAGESLRRK